jgi:hypothetical protein
MWLKRPIHAKERAFTLEKSNQQPVLFPGLLLKPVQVAFDEPMATSDGGSILLGALDQSLGLTDKLVGCLSDDRQPGKVEHTLDELLRQRIFGIANGYVDANDAARLRTDAAHKILLNRDPERDADLASQPTLCRFENSVTESDCFRLGVALAEQVIDRHHRRLGSRKVKKITLDLDGSCDPTHGQQQLSLFNRYYDSHCFFPLFGFLTFNDETDQFLFASILRSGHSKEVEGTLGLLRRVVPYLRKRFPAARIRVRLDAGFKGPELLDLLDELKVEYLVGMAKNSVLAKASKRAMNEARRESKKTGETTQCFGDTEYSAKSWKNVQRRVVFKAECLLSPIHDPKDNERYVVTNLAWTPKNVYGHYCARGDSENRIKELKYGLEIDRTSCHQAMANQFRMIMTAAAYVLFQEMRLRARRTSLAHAQVGTLRLALLKIGGVIKTSVRRVCFHLSDSHPWIDVWKRVAAACGAIPAC